MASIPVSADGLLRRAGGGAGVGGGTDVRPGQRPAGGVAGKRQSMDEYIASLPAQAAFIGGKTLETLTSLPPVPQPKGQGGINNTGINNAGGVGIGINAIGRTGINTIGGMGGGANTLGGAGIGINKPSIAADITANTIGAANLYDDKDKAVEDEEEEVDENDKVDETDKVSDKGDNAGDGKAPGELSPEERSVVNELRNRDREVRAHEQAHVSAGGAYIRGGASYQYQRGPDNKSYAVGGEVGIDTAPERDDPGATITKMQAVRSAALAPNDPSAQDRAVASAAARHEGLARADLAEKARNAANES